MYSSLLVIWLVVVVCQGLTINQYRALRRECDEQLLRGQGGNLPLLIRLAFHDCVGDGGCNGCLDHNHPDNAGLQEIHDALVAAYNSDDVDRSLLSLADFVALCGVEAVERAYRDRYDGNSEFSFKTGRVTVDSCNGDNDNDFPSPLAGYTDTVNWLKTQFGLKDDREAIVLIGAHTMGNTEVENSGHRGPWTRDPNVFDNDYYNVLIDAVNDNWRQIDVGNGKYQWEERRAKQVRRKRDITEILMNLLSQPNRNKRQTAEDRPLMMLNADMSLYKAINVNADGVSTCAQDVAACRDSPGKSIVEDLAADNDAFTEEFIVAFTKMIEKVPAGVTLIAVGDTAPTPTPPPGTPTPAVVSDDPAPATPTPTPPAPTTPASGPSVNTRGTAHLGRMLISVVVFVALSLGV